MARLERLVLVLVALAFAAGVARAANCDGTSVGFTPLDDLGPGTYQGFEGGLYPGGENDLPAGHLADGLAEAGFVRPLDGSGNPDPENGWIVAMSIGMCNTSQEYGAFQSLAGGFSGMNPRVFLLNGAQGGWPAAAIADSAAAFWANIDTKLAQQSLTREQVQVVWFLEANAQPTEPFPVHADSLHAQFGRVMNIVRDRYVNARLAYLSTRIYAGYASTPLNPEPWAYESGFAAKWLIEDQIGGDPGLNFDADAGPVEAPWLAWGPYLWADGLVPRSDGLTWECADFANDGTHPGQGARNKVAAMLLDFFSTDATATPWFLGGPTGVDVSPPRGEIVTVRPPRPNPFETRTTVRVELGEARPVRVDVVTVSGRRLKTIADASLPAGTWAFEWDGSDSDGRPVGPGVYFLQVRSSDVLVRSLKTTLVR